MAEISAGDRRADIPHMFVIQTPNMHTLQFLLAKKAQQPVNPAGVAITWRHKPGRIETLHFIIQEGAEKLGKVTPLDFSDVRL